MSHQIHQRRSFTRLITIAGMIVLMLATIGRPVRIGAAKHPQVRAQFSADEAFEVASVKLNKTNDRSQLNALPAAGRLVITGMTVKSVIQGAYGLQPFELVNDESPILSQRINIDAKTEHPVASVAQMQKMLQPLLADRFKLAIHREVREMNALALVLANKDGRLGPKMKLSNMPCDELGTGFISFFTTAPSTVGDPPTCGFTPSGVGRIVGHGLDMPSVVSLLVIRVRIVDQTGLQGRYDIDVTYTPESFSAAALAQRGDSPMPGVDPNGPSLSIAVEELLGLKLQPRKMPVPVLAIDHIEPLTEN